LLKSKQPNTPRFAPLELVSSLGSDMDLQQVAEQPLGRAYRCLERVIGMNEDEESSVDKECLESARCSLAYLKLELRDYQGASDLAMSILLENDEAYWRKVGGLRERLHKQRLACARLYASEAFTALGNTESAMQLISREQDSSFRNELAVDLSGGVTPNINVNDVSKLIKSLTLVQTNASSVSASMGDRGEAEQLAISALQSSEQDQNSAASGSARRALLFCMLQEGNREGALELLASSE
jgi:tetratricopeptide (TPR) repeat protein